MSAWPLAGREGGERAGHRLEPGCGDRGEQLLDSRLERGDAL